MIFFVTLPSAITMRRPPESLRQGSLRVRQGCISINECQERDGSHCQKGHTWRISFFLFFKLSI